ncbi:two-component sensor histidine kinase, partial [Streptomyces sp. NPDC093808]
PVRQPGAGDPAQASRDPLGRRPGTSAPTADPTALPGNGARVVARSGSTRMTPGTAPGPSTGTEAGPSGSPGPSGGADGGRTAADGNGDGDPRGAERDGEATRGR